MSKARMQPTAQTGIVWKISIFLFLLLAVVLYKMNDYFKQEKSQVAQTQLRTQIVSLKTSVSSQITNLKNVLSSYEYELAESKINWVQLDPFFGIATAQREGGAGSNRYRITQYVGRSGSLGEKWNAGFVEKILSRQVSTSDQLITVQLFQDNSGAKLMALRFAHAKGRALIVVGSAEYFQKYFDILRGGKVTALLQTSEYILAAHSEADYLGTSMEANAVSAKKFLVEKEEIAGTNLTVMNFMSRSSLSKGLAVPWAVVGLIIGFGLLIIGVLIYTMDPLERRIEKYKKQERDQVFNETLSGALVKDKNTNPEQPLVPPPMKDKTPVTPPPRMRSQPVIQTATDVVMSKMKKPSDTENENTSMTYGSVVLDDVEFDENDEFKINKEMIPVKLEKSQVEIRKSSGSLFDPIDNEESISGIQNNNPKEIFERTKLKQNTGVFSINEIETGEDVDSESTFVPSQKKSSVRSDSIFINTTDVSPLDIEEPKMRSEISEVDNIDLDKVLSLDDEIEPEMKAAPVEIRPPVVEKKTPNEFVKENLTSTKFNTGQQIQVIKKPSFDLKRKDFKVDEFQVSIRRPDRS